MKVISVIEDEEVIKKSSSTWDYGRLSHGPHPKRLTCPKNGRTADVHLRRNSK
jgi:hypothetical protein